MTEFSDQSGTAADGTAVVKATGNRHFSDAYRVRIVEAANRCTKPGEISALMRREGLYSSCLARFRRQYAAGVLSGGGPTQRRGRRGSCLVKGGSMAASGLGDEPRQVFDAISRIPMVDVILPTRSGIEIRKRCVARPTEHQAILLQRLGLQLPADTKLTTLK